MSVPLQGPREPCRTRVLRTFEPLSAQAVLGPCFHQTESKEAQTIKKHTHTHTSARNRMYGNTPTHTRKAKSATLPPRQHNTTRTVVWDTIRDTRWQTPSKPNQTCIFSRAWVFFMVPLMCADAIDVRLLHHSYCVRSDVTHAMWGGLDCFLDFLRLSLYNFVLWKDWNTTIGLQQLGSFELHSSHTTNANTTSDPFFWKYLLASCPTWLMSKHFV